MKRSQNFFLKDMGRIGALASSQLPGLAAAAGFMAIVAVATAAYAFLVGPVVESLFGQASVSGGGAAKAITGGLLGSLTNRISGSSPLFIATLVVIAAAVKGGAFWFQRLCLITAGQKILLGLRSTLYDALLTRNPLNPQSRSVGEAVTRFTVDVEMVEEAITKGLMAMAQDALQILALATLAAMLDPTLAAIGLIGFPVLALVISKIGTELRHRRSEVYESFSQLGETVDETVRGLGVIQSFHGEEKMRERFAAKSRSLMGKAVKALLLRALSSPFNEVVGAAALGATLVYAATRIDQGELTPGQFISFFTALLLLYQPVKGFGQAVHSVQSGLAALDRLENTSGFAALPRLWTNAPRPGLSKTPHVRLQSVCVGYAEGNPVLTDVTWDLPPGVNTALVGPSGAGKSTLLDLLAGNLAPLEGSILVDGAPATAEHLREIAAPVPQEPFLFTDSIRLNVLIGNPRATRDQIEQACAAAGVDRFARLLPDGLDAPVGKEGGLLSQGQRQRVCLARAIVSDKPLLLLDEVTASLDGETEDHLSEALDKLAHRTIIVATHRITTARWAHETMLVDGGTVRPVGGKGRPGAQDNRLVALFGAQWSKETNGE